MPQADPDSHCCDCPDRSTPCDSCSNCSTIHFGISALGLACCTQNGSDHVSFFLINDGENFAPLAGVNPCCQSVINGSGTKTNLGIQLDWNVSVLYTGGSTYNLTVSGTFKDTNGTSTDYAFSYTYFSIACGTGGAKNEHPTFMCNNDGGASPGSGHRCSSAYCGTSDFYESIWLFTEVGGGLTFGW